MLEQDMRGFRSIISLPHSISQSEKLLPAIVISSHMEEKQSMYRLKSLKEKTLSLRVFCRGRKA